MADAPDLDTPLPDAPWINFRDPASAELDAVAAKEKFHPLDVEDCRHRNQIAKVVAQDGYTFIVIKTIRFDDAEFELEFDDFDLFVKPSSLVTIQESRESDLALRVAALLRSDGAPLAPWRIAHALIDTAVDDYMPVLDRIGACIDRVEAEVLEDPGPRILQRILGLRRVLIEFRRNASAMREVLNHLIRTVQPGDERYLYLRDVYDHLVRVLDFVETYRDLVTGALDVYLSAIANRTNEIVKVLTIWGTIALPLIVITGFYGMNLDLPLQHKPHAMVLVVGLMVASTIGIIAYFKKKGWM